MPHAAPCAAARLTAADKPVDVVATPRPRRQAKRVEPQLAVLVEVRGRLLHAGDLRLDESGPAGGGHFQATFTYHPDYLQQGLAGAAYALDPINLPLRPESFVTSSRFERLGALFDAAPDAWGRTVMASDEGVAPVSLQESTVLLKGRGSGVGAVVFAPYCADRVATMRAPSPPGGPAGAASALSSLRPGNATMPGVADIDTLYETVRKVETGVEVDERLRQMLMSSWDMGGARPKAVVVDTAGDEWIVKFPRSIDTYSRQRVEWANLEMGRAIGMRVPHLRLHRLPDGECALLVRRFDRVSPEAFGAEHDDDGARHWRVHYLSAVSLVSPPADFDKRQLDTAYGASIFSYARVADIVRAVSANVAHDLQELFARMVLNVLVHNTDDHLKNTGFLMDPASRDFRYRLAPLFDVVTQEHTSKHLLHLGPGVGETDGRPSGRLGVLDNVRAGAPHWGLRAQAVERLISRVQAVVAHRHYYYLLAGMTRVEIAQVERWLPPAAGAPVSYRSPAAAPGALPEAVPQGLE